MLAIIPGLSAKKLFWWIIIALAAPFAKGAETTADTQATFQTATDSPKEYVNIGEALRFLVDEKISAGSRASTALEMLIAPEGLDSQGNLIKFPAVARAAAFLFLNDQRLSLSLGRAIQCPGGEPQCTVAGAEGWPFPLINTGTMLDFDSYFAGTAVQWAYQDAAEGSFVEGAALAAHLADPKAPDWVADFLAEQADQGGKSWGVFLQAYEQASALVYYNRGCSLLTEALNKARTLNGQKHLWEIWRAANCEGFVDAHLADDTCQKPFPAGQNDLMKALYTLQCAKVDENTEATQTALHFLWFIMIEGSTPSPEMAQLRVLCAAMLLGTDAQVPDWMRGTALLGVMGLLVNKQEPMEVLSSDTALWPRMLAAHWALRLSREPSPRTSMHTWLRSTVFGALQGTSEVRQLESIRSLMLMDNPRYFDEAQKNLKALCSLTDCSKAATFIEEVKEQYTPSFWTALEKARQCKRLGTKCLNDEL